MKTVIAITCALLSFVEARTWTNSEGREITADYIKVAGDDVVLNMKGKEYNIPIATLSQEDQDHIATLTQAGEKAAEEALLKKATKKKSRINLEKWVSGDKLTQEDLDDKIVVFHAWNAYCGKCVSYVKDFSKTARRKKKTGATYLIWHWYSEFSLAQKNSEKYELKSVPIYHGSGLGKWDEEKWGEFTWPFVGIIDKSGEIVYMGEENRTFDKKLKELLAQN